MISRTKPGIEDIALTSSQRAINESGRSLSFSSKMGEAVIDTDVVKSVLAAGGLKMEKDDVTPHVETEEERRLLLSPKGSQMTLPLMERYLGAVKAAGLITEANQYKLIRDAAVKNVDALRWLLKSCGGQLTLEEKNHLMWWFIIASHSEIVAVISSVYVPFNHEQSEKILEIVLNILSRDADEYCEYARASRELHLKAPTLGLWGKNFPWKRCDIAFMPQKLRMYELFLREILTFASTYAQAYGEPELGRLYAGSNMKNVLPWEKFWQTVLDFRGLA